MRAKNNIVLGGLVLTCAFALGVAAVADQIEGGFEHSERGRIDPTFAAAFPARASFDLELRGIEVLLTPTAIDVEAAVAALRPHYQAINQDVLKGTDYITVMVWDDGRVAINATYHRGNAQFIDNTNMKLEAELTVNTADRVAGRIWTEGAVELMDGETYSVGLTFDVPISRAPKSEPLPEGGGEPGSALDAVIAAAQAGSWQALGPLLTAELRDSIENGWDETDEERTANIRDRFCQSTPCTVAVLGGAQRIDGVADLDVAAQLEGYKAIHRTRMVREQDRWLFDSTSLITIE